jgi:transcriptional regulator with XRE-family HTH domain
MSLQFHYITTLNVVKYYLSILKYFFEAYDMQIFSDRLKYLRKQKNLTQTDMAEILDCTNRHYQRIEYGKIDLPFSKAITLANFFDVSLDHLAGRDVPAIDSTIESPTGEEPATAEPEDM